MPLLEFATLQEGEHLSLVSTRNVQIKAGFH